MITRSILLQTLCVPCACHCRYCLLSWDNHPVGADYARSKAYAARFAAYLREAHPEIQFDFAFGYSMDHPTLFQELDYLNGHGFTQGQLLQLDGMQFREDSEIEALMAGLKAHGVKHANFTFYGLAKYHDRFAGRNGDFDYLLKLSASAARHGLHTSAGIPLTRENAGQAAELIARLEANSLGQVSAFVPHEEGRGVHLSPIRLTLEDYEKLAPQVQTRLNRRAFRTEAEWVQAENLPAEENRMLLISLTPENLDAFEKADFEAVIRHMEQLDEAYYGALPTFEQLRRLYGNPAGTALYGKRDLFRHYQRRYMQAHNLTLYDVTDERFCGSRRY